MKNWTYQMNIGGKRPTALSGPLAEKKDSNSRKWPTGFWLSRSKSITKWSKLRPNLHRSMWKLLGLWTHIRRRGQTPCALIHRRELLPTRKSKLQRDPSHLEFTRHAIGTKRQLLPQNKTKKLKVTFNELDSTHLNYIQTEWLQLMLSFGQIERIVLIKSLLFKI